MGNISWPRYSSDRVTLEAEGDTFEVLLYDQSMAKRRSEIRTESKPATITSTQPVPSPPAAGSPVPTSPATSTIVPKPTSPAGAVQERGVTPAPASPGGPALPRPDFPRRRTYYPPSVPSQKRRGIEEGRSLKKGYNHMRKGRYLVNKIFVLCLVFGMIGCFGIESLRAEPRGDSLVVAQVSPSQPPDSATTPSPTAPQPSTTQPPAPPQPQPTTPTSPVRPTTPAPPATSVLPQPLPSRAPQPPTPVGSPGSTPTSPTVPPTPPSPPVRPVTPQTGSGVVFNFDNADIYEVIRVMSEILKINYIIDPRVKGVVNIHTSGQISSADVFPIFQSILRLNGATAVKKDGIYEIVPLPEAKKLPSAPFSPSGFGETRF